MSYELSELRSIMNETSNKKDTVGHKILNGIKVGGLILSIPVLIVGGMVITTIMAAAMLIGVKPDKKNSTKLTLEEFNATLDQLESAQKIVIAEQKKSSLWNKIYKYHDNSGYPDPDGIKIGKAKVVSRSKLVEMFKKGVPVYLDIGVMFYEATEPEIYKDFVKDAPDPKDITNDINIEYCNAAHEQAEKEAKEILEKKLKYSPDNPKWNLISISLHSNGDVVWVSIKSKYSSVVLKDSEK